MDGQALRKEIENLQGDLDLEWLNRLAERKREEMNFHDRREDRKLEGDLSPEQEKAQPNKKYYRYADGARLYTDQWLARHVPGRVFLDYACGSGDVAIRCAELGASLSVGIDLSSVSLATARRKAEQKGVADRCLFLQADCEDTKFPSDSIDVMFCGGMLHHLDLSYAFPEMRRILKRGGRVLAYEALSYNPFIRLYRRFTPELRTDWEKDHILSLADVELASRFFDLGERRYWCILSVLSPYLPFLAGVFASLDSICTRLPGLRLMSWIFTFEMIKKEETV